MPRTVCPAACVVCPAAPKGGASPTTVATTWATSSRSVSPRPVCPCVLRVSVPDESRVSACATHYNVTPPPAMTWLPGEAQRCAARL